MKNSLKKKIDKNTTFIFLMFLVFTIILLRLIYLQVFKYDDYKEKANTKSRRFIADQAPRGNIYDSEGTVLATNKQTYNLIFTETNESKSKFYTTVDKVYELLKENNEQPTDKFSLRLDENNNLYFDYNVTNDEDKRVLELRFKKDRGMDEVVLRKKFPKLEGELNAEQQDIVDNILLKVTPEETFQYLVDHYKLYYILNPSESESKKLSKLKASELTNLLLEKYSLSDLRKYMVVKDAIKMQSFSGFKPVNIAENIKEETAFIFFQKLNDLPGVDVSLQPIRYYPYGNVASSVLGYVSSISSESKSKYEERGYDVSTDLIGKAGIESAFENTLKGSKGGTTVKVNSSGRTVEELFTLETVPGNNVHLTIDKDVQKAAEEMLRYQLNYLQTKYKGDVSTKNATRGAAVAIEVDTGKLLALASEPGFDPNIFSQGPLSPELSQKYFNPNYEEFAKKIISQENLNKSIDDLFPKNKYGQREDKYDLYPKPFYNYATMGLIAPGSTFKPLTSVVALEEGVFSPNESINVTSRVFDKYPEIFGNTPPKDNNYLGTVDVKTALAHSSNTYYYESAIRLFNKNSKDGNVVNGLNTIANYAWNFGLGINPESNESPTTGIEITENFGQTYNVSSFKKQISYYSKWDLVNYLESNGKFPNGAKSFPKVDISVNDTDSKPLAQAKVSLKKIVDSKITEAGTGDNISHSKFIENSDSKKFISDIKGALKSIHDNSQKYQESINSSNIDIDKAFTTTATELYNWLINSVCNQIYSATQIAYAAIGQGMNSYTPLQLANYVSTLANGGTRYKLHLVDKITNPDGETIENFSPEVMSKVEISNNTMTAVKEGMRRVNHSDSGTAKSTFKNFPIITGGKTGTATFGADQEEYGRTDFGTYISFAPLDNPKIAVAVVIYDGGHGNLGAPVARAIYEAYFKDELKTNYPNYQPIDLSGVPYNFTLNE